MIKEIKEKLKKELPEDLKKSLMDKKKALEEQKDILK